MESAEDVQEELMADARRPVVVEEGFFAHHNIDRIPIFNIIETTMDNMISIQRIFKIILTVFHLAAWEIVDIMEEEDADSPTIGFRILFKVEVMDQEDADFPIHSNNIFKNTFTQIIQSTMDIQTMAIIKKVIIKLKAIHTEFKICLITLMMLFYNSSADILSL